MEETGRTPELNPGPVWARRSRERPSRAELAAALQVCRRRPACRFRRLVWGLLGLFLVMTGVGGGYYALFEGGDDIFLALGLSLLGVLFLANALLVPGLEFRLRRQLARCHAVTLYPDFAHFADPEDPLDLMVADLRRVERMEGWIVLLWQTGATLTVLPLADEDCAEGGDALLDRLREAAPEAVFRSLTRRPRMPHRLLPAAALVVLLGLSWVWPVMALQGWIGCANGRGGTLYLRYDADTRQIINRATGEPLAWPAAGSPTSRWPTNDCCVVTYPSTDGSVRVELLSPHPDRALRLETDPITGFWQQYADETAAGVTLRWDEALSCYRLYTDEGESVYRQWESFDGLGLALCDDRGAPQWTLVPAVLPQVTFYGIRQEVRALVLTPVSLEGSAPSLVLYPPWEEESAEAGSSPETAQPQFNETIDVCVNEDGLFFTWDGGNSYSQALNAADCRFYGITGRQDLDPLVLRWDTAAFFTVYDNRASVHVTTDQGQTWQVCDLSDFTGLHEMTDRCLGFTDRGFGYAALSSGSSPGTGIAVELYTTRDGGVSWQKITTPQPEKDSLRAVNGLVFADASSGIASMASGQDQPWPHVFMTEDAGQSWRELDLPFEQTGLPYLTRLSDLYCDDNWIMVFSQEPYDDKEAVFQSAAFQDYWEYVTTRTAG